MNMGGRNPTAHKMNKGIVIQTQPKRARIPQKRFLRSNFMFCYFLDLEDF